jgi:hypothetical protein
MVATMGVGMGEPVLLIMGMPMITRMFMCMRMALIFIVLVLVGVMGSITSFPSIVPLHPEAPSRDTVSVATFKPAGGQFYP